MELSSLTVDVLRIEQGEWIKDIPERGDLELKVRGIGNSEYRALWNKLVLALPAKRRRNGVSPDDLDRIQGICLLKASLIDWRGLTIDGKDVPYSYEFAEQLLTSPEYRQVRETVAYAANLVGTDQAQADAELEKNSSTSSAGG